MINSINQDVEVIHKMLLIAYSINSDKNIVKTASIVDNIKEILSDMTTAVKDRIEKEGFVPTAIDYLVDFLLPGKLKILAAFLSMIGVTPSSLFRLIFGVAGQTIKEKGSYSEEDANSDLSKIMSGMNIQKVGSNTNDLLNKYSSLLSGPDTFDDLNKEGNLNTVFVKQAKSDWLTADPFKYIFSLLRGKEKSSFITKVLKLIVKVVLAGLIGITVAEAPTAIKSTYEHALVPAANWVGEKFTGTGSKTEEKPTNSLPEKIPHSLKPSGKGEEVHANSGNTVWFVKLQNDSIKDTLLYWAENVYPELKGKTKEIEECSSFNKLVSIMNKTLDRNELPYYAIPQYEQLHTLRDIVDLFAGEAAKKIS